MKILKKIKFLEESDTQTKVQIVLAVLTIITLLSYVVVSSLQIHQTNKALDKADSSNSYTRRSINLSEQQNKLDMRAYLAYVGIDTIAFNVGKPFRVDLLLKNTGKTLANKIRGTYLQKYRQGPPNQSDSDTLKKHLNGDNLAWPNTDMVTTLIFKLVLTKTDSIKIVNGLEELYIMGLFEYDDVFGVTHYTKYCLFYDPIVRTFNTFEKYNDAN